MAPKLNGIELTRYDDLFKTDSEREADRQERVQIVPAEQVFPYARQPYSVDRPSADLVRLMDSIERTGIAEPLIVRPRSKGGYEIISGHRRDYCAKVVGLDTRPVIVRDYSDEDADILVVDYNINRENLLPSEKAKAYKLKLDAMKRQGARTDLTSGQLGQKLSHGVSVEQVADDAGTSIKQVQRFIRLNKLTPDLMQLVDEGRLKTTPAVELSYLTPDEQEEFLSYMEEEGCTPSLSQAQKLKAASKESVLTKDKIHGIMSARSPSVKPREPQLTIAVSKVERYFPKGCTSEQMESTILKLLENYYRKRQDYER